MFSLEVMTAVGAAVLLFLVWLFAKTRSKDRLDGMMKQRASGSRLVTRAEYVESLAHIPVSLALSDSTIFYENGDMQASIDLDRVDEIEYDDELATGQAIAHGKALRLRSHGHTFEFLIDAASAQKWSTILPPKHFDDAIRAAV
jgi:hypothetical protein